VNTFLVDVLMTGFGLGENSNCFAAAGEEPSPTSGSFSLVLLAIAWWLVFLEALFLQSKQSFRACVQSDIG
jgi:hypothetical protein